MEGGGDGCGSSMPNNQQMMIYLKTTKTVAMEVNSRDTIMDVKAKFSSMEGISPHTQELFFAGNHLKNGSTLIDHNIQNGSTVQMFVGAAREIGGQILIKATWNGEIITLDMNDRHTVHDIKAKIYETEGIHPGSMVALIFAGMELQDGKTLASYNIQTGCTLFAFLRRRDTIKIYVETVARRTVELEVKPCYTVENLKTMIESIRTVPSDQQKLIFSGRSMEDGKKLSDYNITNASTIRMVNTLFFYVQTPTQKCIRLEMERSNIIGDVKMRIQRTEKIPWTNQVLTFNGLRLDDSLTLAYYKIKKNCTLQLAIYGSIDMPIFVKTPERKTLTFVVQKYDLIDKLESQIENRVGIPKNRLFLKYGGKVLYSSYTLKDCNIEKDSTLHLCYG